MLFTQEFLENNIEFIKKFINEHSFVDYIVDFDKNHIFINSEDEIYIRLFTENNLKRKIRFFNDDISCDIVFRNENIELFKILKMKAIRFNNIKEILS